MDFKDLVKSRRSCRKFTDEAITKEELDMLLRAALMAPTGKNRRKWHFVAVTDRAVIDALAACKDHGAEFLTGAAAAVAITCDPEETDIWVEDCAIAAITIQYQAEELGLGTCWAHMRGRGLPTGETADEAIRKVLDLPETQHCLCVIGIGHKAESRNPQNEEKLLWDSVTYR